MKMPIYFCAIPFILLLCFVSNEAGSKRSICSWQPRYENQTCTKEQFQCFNGNCISRGWYCDSGNDCGDYSDELYCISERDCPKNPLFVKCPNSQKCVREEWICDGVKDCPSGEDERNCGGMLNQQYIIMPRVHKWLYNQKTECVTEKWGSLVDKLAVTFFFAHRNFTSTENETLSEVAYEISIQLLSRLSKMKLQHIPSTDLASLTNAFLVSCLDPRKFHGFDIVQELRTRVDRQNYTNPYVLLSLCNAGDTITESDKMKLIDTFYNKRRTFWTDMQAVAVMALACASKQPGNDVDRETLRELTMELKQRQYRDGSVEDLQTTALVMQALISTDSERDPDNFDDAKALEEILRNQKSDGSFGDLMNTYFVTPVLVCKSLVDINSDHCPHVRRDEISALENLAIRSGPKVRVRYSLWIGNKKDLERAMTLRVPANMSFYGIMEIAAEIDSRYRFEYKVNNGKPYINAISGLRDNPENGKFWFLYTVKDGQASPSTDSPADVTPNGNDHYVMWYRSGSWIE